MAASRSRPGQNSMSRMPRCSAAGQDNKRRPCVCVCGVGGVGGVGRERPVHSPRRRQTVDQHVVTAGVQHLRVHARCGRPPLPCPACLTRSGTGTARCWGASSAAAAQPPAQGSWDRQALLPRRCCGQRGGTLQHTLCLVFGILCRPQLAWTCARLPLPALAWMNSTWLRARSPHSTTLAAARVWPPRTTFHTEPNAPVPAQRGARAQAACNNAADTTAAKMLKACRAASPLFLGPPASPCRTPACRAALT